jgi:hypothetical protein
MDGKICGDRYVVIAVGFLLLKQNPNKNSVQDNRKVVSHVRRYERCIWLDPSGFFLYDQTVL